MPQTNRACRPNRACRSVLAVALAMGTTGCTSTWERILPTMARQTPVETPEEGSAEMTAATALAASADPGRDEAASDFAPVVFDAPLDADWRQAEDVGAATDPASVAPALFDVNVDELASEASDSPIAPATSMSLSDFEALALAQNPAIKELAATTQKAAGFRTQVSLRANPVIGYQGQQLADEGTDQHLVFVEQEFVTAGKLELNRRVLNHALRAQLLELEAQKFRVTTDVRLRFYDALEAQQRVELIDEFSEVATKGLQLAEARERAFEGSKIDVLQAKVLQSEIGLARRQAEVAFQSAWRELVAIAGAPQLPPVPLHGSLPDTSEPLDWSSLGATLIANSPEYNAAQTRVTQARAELQRHGVQSIPNLLVQFGAGVDNSTESGMMNIEVGAPIPIFNKNQGNLAAARAEYCRAVMEAQRIANAIQARLAAVSRDHDSAAAAVATYSDNILPSAQESLDLAELAYQAGETSFVQVLVARRTYFDSNLQYLQAQSQLAQAQAQVDGFVLTGGLDPVIDGSGSDSLRDLTFSQQ